MKFFSTRDPERRLFESAQVIKQGLAADGGLFVPEAIPQLSQNDITKLCKLSYTERAAYILSLFLTDYTYEELLEDCTVAYSEESFEGGAAPLKKVTDEIFTLELWHGPTAAFKDMALQIMPRLLSRALVKTNEANTALILVATSGDTGKAALEGYKDVDKIKIIVFYPVDGVSDIQKLQMSTQSGSNVNVCAIKGNFDDAQNGVKKIFADEDAKNRLLDNAYILSSANSINWGRLAPQIVYYVSAYCDLLNASEIEFGESVNVCVPTGNFGNILAAYIAKNMGIPLNKLVCASNANNILTDFLQSGTYDRNRDFHLTMSPSMDILISSNLERLLYFVSDANTVTTYMNDLKINGKYTVSNDIKEKISENFIGYYADEKETADTVNKFYNTYGYLADTHTSVALNCAEKFMSEYNDGKKMIVASTASPYKFAADVYRSITGENANDGTGVLEQLSALTNTEITKPLRDLDKKEIRFNKVIEAESMLDEVYSFM